MHSERIDQGYELKFSMAFVNENCKYHVFSKWFKSFSSIHTQIEIVKHKMIRENIYIYHALL